MSDINSIRKIFNSSISFDKYGIGRPNEFMNAIILLLEVIENIQNNCDCFSFDDIIISLLEGTNITFDIDETNETITINAIGGSGGGAYGCAENVSCLFLLPESEPCGEMDAENVSCLI